MAFFNGKELPNGIAPLVSQRKAAEDTLEYIRKRMLGLIPQYKTCYNNMNIALGGSIEPNTILTIAGMSGSGKSTMSKRIIYSINENLHKEGKECITLCFNYEMLAFKTVGRELANAAKRSVGNLYSSNEMLNEEDYEKIERYFIPQLKKYPIYYVEEPGTHDSIKNTIMWYWNELCVNPGKLDKLLIIEIDHTLLIKGSGDKDAEKMKIDKLMEDLIFLKKYIASKGGNVLFIVISQLNRGIEHIERLKTPTMHRPIKSDLTQSDNVYQGSDYVIIGHHPAKLHLQSYTEENFPTSILLDRKTNIRLNFIYYHVLKNRDGEPDFTAVMVGNLKYFEFIEISREEFSRIKKDSEKGQPVFLNDTLSEDDKLLEGLI